MLRVQSGERSGAGTGDIELIRASRADAQVTEANAARIDSDQTALPELLAAGVQFLITGKRLQLPDNVLAGKLNDARLAHDVCSGNRARMLCSLAAQMPRSVIKPVTRRRGVTSNA